MVWVTVCMCLVLHSRKCSVVTLRALWCGWLCMCLVLHSRKYSVVTLHALWCGWLCAGFPSSRLHQSGETRALLHLLQNSKVQQFFQRTFTSLGTWVLSLSDRQVFTCQSAFFLFFPVWSQSDTGKILIQRVFFGGRCTSYTSKYIQE